MPTGHVQLQFNSQLRKQYYTILVLPTRPRVSVAHKYPTNSTQVFRLSDLTPEPSRPTRTKEKSIYQRKLKSDGYQIALKTALGYA